MPESPARPLLLTDRDVRERLDARVAVDAARRAVLDAYRGRLAAPPRVHAELAELDLTFTAGGYAEGPLGFRAYSSWAGDSDQIVVVWDGYRRVHGVVVGSELGVCRTGALGGVAVGALARAGSSSVAVVGSGRQAWGQLWALGASFVPSEVRVFSPTAAHREPFAGRVRDELGWQAWATETAEEAVRNADIVLVATRSPRPVLKLDWIAPGAHVSTVGPKTRSRHELPLELAGRADVVVSDSPGQAAAYPEPFFTERPLTHLGAVLAGDTPGRTAEDAITLYCSTGLAGSEVVLAQTLLERAGAG